MRLKFGYNRLIQENSQFTVGGPLISYDSAQVRMWIILDINNNHFYHPGKSQICAGAGYVFRPSESHSERLWDNLASWWWYNVLKNQDFLFTSWTYLHFKMEGWLEEDAQTKERERCSKNQYLKITAKHLNQKERWETKEIYSYCGSCREIGRGHEYLIPYIFVKRADTR